MLKNHSILIAKILIFISFILLTWSAILYYMEFSASLEPKENVPLVKNSNKHEINITNKDNNISTTENNVESTNENTTPNDEIEQTQPSENIPTTSKPQDDYPSVPNQQQSQPPSITQSQNNTPSITELNNNLRIRIEQEYGITIFYGTETYGYKVGGLETYVEENEYTIQNALNNLSYCMSLYPFDFFQEINRGGIPLTIYLIKNYSSKGVTGATNAFNTRTDISISLEHDFAESFNHEVFHYIEKYISKKGDNFTGWNTLNPLDFSYGNARTELSYKSTFSENAPFVNIYAQTSAAEDRASTFEYMMQQTKASCLNKDKIVWRKADYMAQKIDLIFNSVSPNITEYWERFIY